MSLLWHRLKDLSVGSRVFYIGDGCKGTIQNDEPWSSGASKIIKWDDGKVTRIDTQNRTMSDRSGIDLC